MDMADISPHTACQKGDIESLRHILSHDSYDVNTKDAKGKTLVMGAVENCQKEVLEFLVSKGCDLTLQDTHKRNILHVSSTGENSDITEFILSQNVLDINGIDQNGNTPIMLAAESGREVNFFLLKDGGSDFSLVDSKGNSILHHGSSGGSMKIVEYLLSEGSVDVNKTNLHGASSIMLAAGRGHRKVFEFLAERGSNLSTSDAQDRTVLHMATQGGDAQIVEYILARDRTALNKRDNEKMTPVMMAAVNGHKEIFYLLVAQDCDLTGVSQNGISIIHHACIGGSVEIVEYILSQENIDVDKKGQSGVTPVMLAAKKGHKKVFDVLVFRKCDLHCVDDKSNNILHHAAFGGNLEIVQYITSRNIVDINSKGRYGMTPVMMAALRDHNDVFELLVNKGCTMFPVCDLGYNVLHLACFSDNRRVVEYILTNDIIPATSRGKYDRTPMMMAADQGHKEIFDLFVKKGCDFSIIDGGGLNMLHIACVGGNVGIIKYITSLGVFDIDSRSGHFGRTAVMIAAERNRKEAFDFLVGKGCDLTLEDDRGNNILHAACVGGGVEMVEYILEQNIVNVNKASKDGDIPIMLAESNHHNEVVELLKLKGCKVIGCVIS